MKRKSYDNNNSRNNVNGNVKKRHASPKRYNTNNISSEISSINQSPTSFTLRKNRKSTDKNKTAESHLNQNNYLDSDYNVTASKFGAARLPEMKSLWMTYLSQSLFVDTTTTVTTSSDKEEAKNESTNIQRYGDTWYYRSGGRKTSSRHLRRRTGSHNRRSRHRFPSRAATNTNDDTIQENENDVTESSTDHTVMQKNYIKVKSRKARRKPATLRHKFSVSWVEPNSIHNTDKKWLETHLWHTKRFHISPALSTHNYWCIPLGHNNRSASAALRLAKTKSTIQDATWRFGGQLITVQIPLLSDSDSSDTMMSVAMEKIQRLVDIIELLCGGNIQFNSAQFLTNHLVLAGLQMGYGMIYDLERYSFPSGLIGPASFLFGCDVAQDNNDNEGVKYRYYYSVRIMTCTEIFHHVYDLLHEIVENHNDTQNEDSSNICSNDEKITVSLSCGQSLVKVRGSEATTALAKIFQTPVPLHKMKDQNYVNNKGYIGWDDICHLNYAHFIMMHGTVMNQTKSKLRTFSDTSHTCFSSSNLEYVDESAKSFIHDFYKNNDSENMLIDGKSILVQKRNKDEICVISQCPNQVIQGSKSYEQNISISGWDVLCPSDVTTQIFQSLNHYGGACAIGLIEETYLATEANPPLLLWPRDYPDTDIGKLYWSGADDEWNLLRYCMEEGLKGNNIKTGLYRLMKHCREIKQAIVDDNEDDNNTKSTRSDNINPIVKSIDWATINKIYNTNGVDKSNSLDDEQEEILDSCHEATLVARGAFMIPFNKAISSFASNYIFPETSPEVATNRRKRRVIPSDYTIITIPPLPREQLKVYKNECKALLSSLSFPTLVRCHLTMEGKGTLQSGMIITSVIRQIDSSSSTDVTLSATNTNDTKHDSHLGYIVAGSFSSSRGISHGVGFVSSSKLLHFLSSNDENSTFNSVEGIIIAVKSKNGIQRIGIRVNIHDCCKKVMYSACLVLLP